MPKTDVVYIYDGTLLSRKNETVPFVATCMDLEITVLIPVSQRQMSDDIVFM